MDLDRLLDAHDGDDAPPSRRGMAARTFGLAVVAAMVGVVLLALLLYGVVVGGAALWEAWWDDFA